MTKNELIISHIYFAEKLAIQKKRSSPSNVYLEDLKSAAYKGLVEAAQRYKEGSFSAFARKRIIGEMQDYISELWKDRKKEFVLKDCVLDKKVCGINDIIDFVPEDMRNLLKWLFVENMTYDEIGNKLGICRSAVFRRVQKCLDKIKELVYNDIT